MQDQVEIGNGSLRAGIKAQGAELCSLVHARVGEVLWQAEPAWPRHSPVLFPIVGKLRDDAYAHGGQRFGMTQHGFARDRRFGWEEVTATSCRAVLQQDAASLAAYPFAFRLELHYAVAGETLRLTYRVSNAGEAPMPFGLGAHPGFRWPLREGAAHGLEFEQEEPAPIARLRGGLLETDAEPSPVQGRVLPLSRALFEADAIVMPAPRSLSLRYGAEGGPALRFAWHGLAHLGLWARPGGDFLCIEPWQGLPDPIGFSGELADKPGMVLLPPGETWEAGWEVTVEP